MGITTAETVCLDLTRLISRVGQGPWTGVDRVEAAYLRYLLQSEYRVFFAVRTGSGMLLLDRAGGVQLWEHLTGTADWRRRDLLSRVSYRLSPMRQRAEATLRRLAVGRSGRKGFARLLQRFVHGPSQYLNVGHSNLDPRTFRAVTEQPGMTATVLIHDVIPLDHPEFQRAGTVESFRAKMAVVSRYADRVIYNSADSQKHAEVHFDKMGRVPSAVVALLGVETDAVGALPAGDAPAAPYFVTVGTIEPRKNHALLLDVWESLTAPRPELWIIGKRGWNNSAVFERLDRADETSGIRERSDLDDGAVRALISGAEAFLFPSVVEGYGLPPLEAAALGVPVIAAELEVYGETLGDYAVYLDPRDSYAWKSEIISRMETPSKRLAQVDLPTWDAHFGCVFGNCAVGDGGDAKRSAGS